MAQSVRDSLIQLLERRFSGGVVYCTPDIPRPWPLKRVESAQRLGSRIFELIRFRPKLNLLIHRAGERLCTGRKQPSFFYTSLRVVELVLTGEDKHRVVPPILPSVGIPLAALNNGYK